MECFFYFGPVFFSKMNGMLKINDVKFYKV